MLHRKRKINSLDTKKVCLPSRFELINWINDTLLLPLTKIQELGAGNVYCQLLDAAFPEKVPLYKVKWNAKSYGDFVHNFKILQSSFERLGIEKMIEVEKLSQIKYQDNLEFIQWMKMFLQDKIDLQTYQPLKRRNYMKLDLSFARKKKFSLSLNANKQNSFGLNSQNYSGINSKQTSLRSSMISQVNPSKMELSYQGWTKRNQNFLDTFHLELENKMQKYEKIIDKREIFVEDVGIVESDGQDEQ